MFSGRRVRSALAVVASVGLLGACSSSGSGESGEGDNTPANSPVADGSGAGEPSGATVKIGVICSCTGGSFGNTHEPPKKTVQAWAKSLNASGGLAGHRVKVIIKDDASNPGKAVTAAQSLVSEQVSAIIDLSVLAGAWAKTVDDAGIPVIGGNMSAPLYYQDPNFYPAGQTNNSIVAADVLTAKLAGAKTFGQLYCAEAPQCQESVKPHKKAGARLGIPVVYSASISGTAPNYTAQCLAAKQAGVEGLFIGHSAEVFARVAQDCTRQGYEPAYIEQGTGYTKDLPSKPGLTDSLWIVFSVLPFFADEPPVQRMNDAVDKYFPGLRDEREWNQLAAEAWAGGVLIEKAVEASEVKGTDGISADDMVKGLNSLENETLDGWSPPLTFTEGKPHSVDCWFTARVENGKPKLANDGKLSCQS